VGYPLHHGIEGAPLEEVGRVYGVPGAAQLLGEGDDAGGQPLRVVEEHYLGHRNPSRKDDVLSYPGPLVEAGAKSTGLGAASQGHDQGYFREHGFETV
jgi:hypothetical protein